MFRSYRSFLTLGLALLLGAPALHAQLDPRLQTSKTDFLDMYQQSASVRAKPEIISVIDFSRSMASLMYHPLYVNRDVNDADDYRYMRFQLTDENGGTPANNRYWIQATATTCGAAGQNPGTAYTRGYVTVNVDGSAFFTHYDNPSYCNPITANTYNTAPTISFYAQSPGNTNAYARVYFNPQNNSVTFGANDHTPYLLGSNATTGTQGSHPKYAMSVIAVTPASGPYAPNTVVTLKATMTTSNWQEGDPAINGGINWGYDNGCCGFNSGAVWVDKGGGVYESTTTIKIPDWVAYTTSGNPGNQTQLSPIIVSPGTTFSAGNALTFKAYFLSQGAGVSSSITWTTSAVDTSNLCAGTPPPITGGPSTAGLNAATSTTVNYTVPNRCTNGNTGGTQAYVTAYLDVSPGANFNYNTGLSASLAVNHGGKAVVYPGALAVNTLPGEPVLLRKPDGTTVTPADADAAGGSLPGASLGRWDVRNWIRASSHARMYTNSGGPYRYIDIPIPWKVMDRSSTGNPLSSKTIKDEQIVHSFDSNGNPVTTTYGSGLQMEIDTTYQVEGAVGGVFASDTLGNPAPAGTAMGNRATNVYLYNVAYRPAYIAWLVNGVFQNDKPNEPNYAPLNASFFLGSNNTKGYSIAFEGYDNDSHFWNYNHMSWGASFGPAGSNWGLITVPQYDGTGAYTGTVQEDASKYATPALTRAQAAKQAAIYTWINHQADVLWAFREIDPTGEAGSGAATGIDNNSSTVLSANDPTTTHVNGNDTGWTVLNNTDAQGINSSTGNSVKGMKRIAGLFPNGSTPLTYAMARALAQFNDPSSVFNPIVGANVSSCVNQFMLFFTDGIDNNGTSVTNNANLGTPYITGDGSTIPYSISALAGNQAILATPTLIDRSGVNWNLFTFAGVAAHMADSTLGSRTAGVDFMAAPAATSKSGAPSTFLPYAVNQRNGVTLATDHRITTMTVGVNLGGKYTDPSSPKRSLFLAATVGDPATNSGLLNSFHGFIPPVLDGSGNVLVQNDWIPDPSDPGNYPKVGMRGPGAVYFFDATDPDKLKAAMDYAFRIAISSGGNAATSSPNIPFIGATLGSQIYMGQFKPPKAGGVIWTGDLMMFGTREKDGKISIIDKSGNITTTLDDTTAQWSTASRLATPTNSWLSRKLFTRLPGTAANPDRGLHTFSDVGAAYTAADAADNTAGLKNYAAIVNLAAGSAAQKAVIQNAMGGATTGPLDGSSRPTTNRLNIMGDIVNSAPAALEYKHDDSIISAGISAHAPLSAVGGNHFRAILVGTNQGWLHCFGEVTKQATVTDAGGVDHQITTGAVDELWAFMPTDFLSRLDSSYGASAGSNPHRTMVDGSPAIYFLDLPPSGGGSGNGLVDSAGPSQERAIAIVGLRKGGRSYYAINIKDPFNPVLQWSIVPDEADRFPSSRNLSGLSLPTLQGIIANMGFSTSAPSLGRAAFTYGGTTKLRDVVFLGGGYSVPEVEANFLTSGKTTLLGRSVLAVDVYTGEVLSAVDMTALPGVTTTLGNPSTCSIGPIPAGLVPFEFILNSGMAQRAYFLDYKGGLWAWGSKAVADSSAGPLQDYRIDNSDLAKWTSDGTTSGSVGLRKVAQDATGYNARYTTLPAPFRLGSFPGTGKAAGAPAPATVGIAMVSGDRFNPVDYQYVAGTKPTNHRLTVVFDRQDSRAWGLDSASGPDAAIQDTNLKNFTSNTVSADPGSLCPGGVWSAITAGCPEFYLAPSSGDPYMGYYVNFPGQDAKGFVPKGITAPMVVAGSLFYSYFWPSTADPCSGGTGTSSSNVICDVVSPLVADSRTTVACKAGTVTTWSGVSSEYIAFGTRGVIQGGTTAVANPPVGGSSTTLSLQTQLGKSTERYPKARVWRTVR